MVQAWWFNGSYKYKYIYKYMYPFSTIEERTNLHSYEIIPGYQT